MRRLLSGVCLLLVVWLIFACGPAWAGGQVGAGPLFAQAAKKPSAVEHVLDEKQHWHFFDSVPPIPLPPKIFGFQITKFMILELIAALLVIAIYVPLARRLRNGQPASGWRDNMLEVLLTFIRDEIAKPSIGEHEADRYRALSVDHVHVHSLL